ncbi:MAG: type II toxin-antitoxin system RelB/DinJ family antitoxin [Treponema sp.]|nr:type II toxin-antitoxin system RelB/DinJ family antitoxin [Treponema sp.]
MASCVVQVRVDENLRKEVCEILEHLGLGLSDGVRLFFNRVVEENGIPFPMKIEKNENKPSLFDIDKFLAREGE